MGVDEPLHLVISVSLTQSAAGLLFCMQSEDKGSRLTMEDVHVVQLDARPQGFDHSVR